MMNEAQKSLIGAIVKAEFSEEKRADIELKGHQFSVCFITVNRKCYDFNSTPTLQLKMDGKRIAKKAAFAVLA